jgi:hypothetical protein
MNPTRKTAFTETLEVRTGGLRRTRMRFRAPTGLPERFFKRASLDFSLLFC